MPVQATYPGVYVQEVPSGVRTITGVSTSITAFLGSAKRGPINKATSILSYADYEKRFGGLSKTSEMSYAVKQFFLNGGAQAIVVRLARDPVAAAIPLHSASPQNPANEVLRVTALDQGSDGNQIEVRVNYNTSNPDSTFNLVVNYTSADNPADSRSETFTNVSMNSSHPRYLVAIVEQSSTLIRVERTPNIAAALGDGTALSGALLKSDGTVIDVNDLIDPTHNQFRIAVNGLDPVNVQINLPLVGVDADAKLFSLCNLIQNQVIAQANGQPALNNFLCQLTAGDRRIYMTSGAGGENSRVEILPGLGNDAAARLKLGVGLGGTQIDAAATIRPREVPDHSTLTSSDIVNADIQTLTGGNQSFRLSIDGGAPDLITIDMVLAGADHAARMTEIAALIQSAVRSLRPASPAYSGFTCTAINGTTPATERRLVLSPGSRGSSSSIVVSEAVGGNFASGLKLLASTSATTAQASNVMLQGGIEYDISDATRYQIYTGSRANREGIYALESTDLFNILCLPGIEDGGILMEAEAYCRERRAFLIADAPTGSRVPSDMVTIMAGTNLPKSDHAAVYYPWIKVSDPLNGGALRKTAPSGAIAGLYARIDSSRGVWKAPAGTEASLTGVRGLEYPLTDRETGLLNPLGVNCLRIFPDAGAVSWGARTLNGGDRAASEWKYIPIRRTALFIEESLYRGLKWVVFEPNDEPLWAQIRLNVGAFMHNLFRQGAFQGQKKNDAYFVKCDAETTTQNDINLGIVNIWVGFAPLKPAEFVILYLQQMTGQIQV